MPLPFSRFIRFSPIIVVIVVACVSVTLPCYGQLPNSIIVGDSPSAQQMADIRSYVNDRVMQLVVAESPDAIRRARESLCEPLKRTNAAEGFRQRYSQVVAESFMSNDVMLHDDPLVRLNVQVAVGTFYHGSGSLLIIDGLSDDSPAVRYWAAKSIVLITKRNGAVFTPSQVDSLIDALTLTSADEESVYVIEQIYRALAGLDAMDILLAELEKVLARPIDQCTMSGLLVEEVGLQNICRSVYFHYKKYSEEEVKHIAAVLAQYLQKADAIMTTNPRRKAAAFELVRMIEMYFNFVVDRIAHDSVPGPSLYVPLIGKRDLDFKLNLALWIGTDDKPGRLTQKLGIPLQDMRWNPGKAE